MNVLVISPYPTLPPITGGAVRTYSLCKLFVESDHKVYLCNQVSPRWMKKSGWKGGVDETCTLSGLRVYSYKERIKPEILFNLPLFTKLASVLRKEKIDAMILEFPFQALMAMVLSRLSGIPYYLNAHNVEFERFNLLGRKAFSSIVHRVEGLAVRNAREVFAVSKRDADIVERLYGRKSQVAPNGVDTEKFRPADSSQLKINLGLEGRPVILFFGNLRYPPNAEAVRIIVERIAPEVTEEVPEAVFLIAGVCPPQEYNDKSDAKTVRFLGPVERIEDYVNLADIVIVPILRGGGTRIKIMEACACAKVVLSTPQGAEGLELTDGEEILLSEIGDFSRRIVEVLQENGCDDLEKSARRWALGLDWSKTLQPIMDRVVSDCNPNPVFPNQPGSGKPCTVNN